MMRMTLTLDPRDKYTIVPGEGAMSPSLVAGGVIFEVALVPSDRIRCMHDFADAVRHWQEEVELYHAGKATRDIADAICDWREEVELYHSAKATLPGAANLLRTDNKALTGAAMMRRAIEAAAEGLFDDWTERERPAYNEDEGER